MVGPPLQRKKMRLSSSPAKAHGSPSGGGGGGNTNQKPRVSKKSVLGSPLAHRHEYNGPVVVPTMPAIGMGGLDLSAGPHAQLQKQRTMGNTNANNTAPPMNGGGTAAPDSPSEGASARAAYVNHVPGSWCPKTPYGPQVRHTLTAHRDRPPTATEPRASTQRAWAARPNPTQPHTSLPPPPPPRW